MNNSFVSEKKRISISANNSWYIYNFRSELIKSLVSLGYEVSCVSGDDTYKNQINSLGASFSVIDFKSRSRNPFVILANIISYVKYCRAYKPVVFLTYNPMPNLCVSMSSFFCSFRQIATISGFGLLSDAVKGKDNRGIYLKLKIGTFINYLKSPDVVFCQNSEDFDFVRHVRGERATIRVMGSGVPLDKFFPTIRSYEKLRFLFAGRFLESKGVRDYIRAAKESEVHRSEFYVCGLPVSGEGGISEEQIKAEIEGSRIVYLGHEHNMVDRLASVDIVVLPSQYGEGIPRSLIEAAASGCVLVAYDNDGVREIVRDTENGFLLPLPSVNDLKGVFEYIDTASSDLLKSYSTSSRSIACDRFSVDTVNMEYVRSIETLTKGI